MKTKTFNIKDLINKDVVDNKTTVTVTLKDCLSSPTTTTTTTASMTDTLYREDNRVKTFVNWPHTFIDPKKLAQTGFSYIGPDDNVKCYFCKAEIGRWEPEDDEVTEHIRWSPNCPLLKRRETNNVPISEADLDRILPPLTYDVCGPFSRVEMRQGSYAESSFTVPAIATQQSLRNPEHPEYAIESARLRSYEDWPKTMKQTPKDLSDAGFFYTQTGDRVKCFSCGGGLRDWDENDVPWEQHALWFGKCEYMKLMKGQEYIDAVIAANSENTLCTDQETKTINDENIRSNQNGTNCVKVAASRSVTSAAAAASSSSSASVSTNVEKDEHNDDKKLCESKLCKICYSCEYNTAFFPCGHVVACAKCASSVTKCPMCRKPFEHVIRVYFS